MSQNHNTFGNRIYSCHKIEYQKKTISLTRTSPNNNDTIILIQKSTK